jgi:hypothetical protein
MSTGIYKAQALRKAGDAASWTAENPVLSIGEIGIETDTNKVKIGDGVTAYNSLNYLTTSGSSDGTEVTSFNGRTGVVTLTLADVTGVGGAPTASPVFTGVVTVPTPLATDNSTAAASTAFVKTAIAAIPTASTTTAGLVKEAAHQANASGWTDATAMANFNALLAALQAAGLMA